MDVTVDIKIKDTNCMLMLEGNQNIEDVFRLIWELLSLYDGYFTNQYLMKLMEY